ncbi:MAG: hypothetical protein MUE44_23425 [Oscillatoriaceae cyanobacterium Prado104]|jgi:hypothetical protein|nr:hypothetical protein [Oscillatoriaceae cyanobacterium Prado104]
MVRYTLPQNPEVILTVKGKDSAKAREEAMDRLMELMEKGDLGSELKEGFGPKQFVEVKELEDIASEGEDAITEAIQILSNLASLKLKMMESREEALKIRAAIDILFTDEPVSAEEIGRLKDGFKVLKNFAQANVRYREARSKAEEARAILDEALKSGETENKPLKPAK